MLVLNWIKIFRLWVLLWVEWQLLKSLVFNLINYHQLYCTHVFTPLRIYTIQLWSPLSRSISDKSISGVIKFRLFLLNFHQYIFISRAEDVRERTGCRRRVSPRHCARGLQVLQPSFNNPLIAHNYRSPLPIYSYYFVLFQNILSHPPI